MKDSIENIFKNHKVSFDVHQPNEGHQARFLAKLNADKTRLNKSHTKNYWKPVLAIAASLMICFAVFVGLNTQSSSMDLASVSPELSETQDFFIAIITEELKKIDDARSPLTEHIINDAVFQLKILEKDYLPLKNDLNQSGNDKRVIYAMISNFQSRIDVLTEVLDKIEDLKDLNNTINETENTL